MKEPSVLLESVGRVGIITLNRPAQRNALNYGLMDALGDSLLKLDVQKDIGVIIITGSDKFFAAGADTAAMADWDYMDVYQGGFITRNWETIRRVRKPAIAAVASYAMGDGFELALACDILIAADNTKFALPEVKLALLPGAEGTQRLPLAIGKAKAVDMCLSGRNMDAQEAERNGLVSRVVPVCHLHNASLSLATEMANYSLPALVAIKESINRAYESSLAEGIALERRQLYARFVSADAHEGMHAFLKKRQPQFVHR